jgi:hypothetical protein
MKRVLVILCLVLSASPARAEPTWWQQFYVHTGLRTSLGLERATTPTLALGYRLEHGRWGADLAVVDVQQGLDEGVHELGRLGLVRSQPLGHGRAWLSLSAGYSVARGWVPSDLPRRRGHGAQVGASVGYDVIVSATLRAFAEVRVGLPLYDLRDQYGSMDSSIRIVPLDFAIGTRF